MKAAQKMEINHQKIQLFRFQNGIKVFILRSRNLFFFYMLYGIFQEEIVTQELGPKKEKFKYTLFLIFIQCIVNAICAYGMVLYQKDHSKVPITEYFLLPLLI